MLSFPKQDRITVLYVPTYIFLMLGISPVDYRLAAITATQRKSNFGINRTNGINVNEHQTP